MTYAVWVQSTLYNTPKIFCLYSDWHITKQFLFLSSFTFSNSDLQTFYLFCHISWPQPFRHGLDPGLSVTWSLALTLWLLPMGPALLTLDLLPGSTGSWRGHGCQKRGGTNASPPCCQKWKNKVSFATYLCIVAILGCEPAHKQASFSFTSSM